MLKINFGEPSQGGAVIRPIPLISITQNVIRNKVGTLGSYYDITLNGTILPDEGSPLYLVQDIRNHNKSLSDIPSSFFAGYNRPAHESIDAGHAMASIVTKQHLLRELFSRDGLTYELLPASVSPDFTNNILPDTPVIIFNPTLQSISFEEGIYVNSCKYTVNLRAEVLLDADKKVIADGNINSVFAPSGSSTLKTPLRSNTRLSVADQLNIFGGFIEDYSESWSIETEEGKGITNTRTASSLGSPLPNDHITSIRTYRLTRNVSATGRVLYYESGNNVVRKEAWEQARDYIYKVILKDTDNNLSNNSTGYEQFPEYTLSPYFASGFLNIAKDSFGGYNHLRTQSIDPAAGSCTITDSWLLSSGTAYEDYRLSLSKSVDNSSHKVTIEGTIKGLSSAHAGDKIYGGSISGIPTNMNTSNNPINSPYQNALHKFHQVTNSGQYGPNCWLYKRASSAVHLPLNFVPLSISLGSNEFTGEITYSVDYDTRPFNLVSGTLSETISCNDTYPGDVFAVIPVIGRQTGPVLQYIGTRTEYQRSLTIDLIMDRYWSSGNHTLLRDRIRAFNLLSKPSLNQPFRGQIKNIIDAYSPARETGIRKYYVSPPVETWDATSGRYSLSINWTYEVNR
jgi:hypothetical protein